MSETAKQLFDGLRAAKDAAQAIAPGLRNVGVDLKAELQRLGTQGSMEAASAIFNGDAFVPYGPGQYTPEHTHEQQHEHQNEQDLGREQ